MNKLVLRTIDEIAKKLPDIPFQSGVEKQKISGKDVLLSNTKEINGEPVDEEKEYILNVPVILNTNHKRKMKKIYKRRGKIGLMTYLRPYVKPDDFGVFQSTLMKSIP